MAEIIFMKISPRLHLRVIAFYDNIFTTHEKVYCHYCHLYPGTVTPGDVDSCRHDARGTCCSTDYFYLFGDYTPDGASTRRQPEWSLSGAIKLARSGKKGTWVEDLTSAKWTKLSACVGEIQWLPDDTGVILAVTGTQAQEFEKMHPHCTFYCLPLSKPARKLTALTQVVAWKVIPNGTGLVATRLSHRRKCVGYTAARVETQLFLFGKGRWHSIEFLDR